MTPPTWYGRTRNGYYIEGFPSVLRRTAGRLVGETWSRDHHTAWPDYGKPAKERMCESCPDRCWWICWFLDCEPLAAIMDEFELEQELKKEEEMKAAEKPGCQTCGNEIAVYRLLSESVVTLDSKGNPVMGGKPTHKESVVCPKCGNDPRSTPK